MSAVAERFRSIPLPSLPPDTIGFALRSALAIVGALYIAFWLQLESASSAAVTAGILSQPSRGMVLSKAANRFAGTLVGALVAVVLVANFGQDRTMLLGGFALWIGLCVTTATLLRDFRAYGAVLAGYTALLVALPGVGRPALLHQLAAARCVEILLGIICAGVLSRLVLPQQLRPALMQIGRAHV